MTRSRVSVHRLSVRLCLHALATSLAIIPNGCNRKPTGTTATQSVSEALPASVVPRFTDVADAAGIHFQYDQGKTGDCWLVEVTGGGLGWLDFNGDGYPDLLCANGRPLPLSPADSASSGAALFLNLRDGTFQDITRSAGVGHDIYGMGVAVGDLDNDGFDDFIETGYGKTLLFENKSDGTVRVHRLALPTSEPEWTTSAAFLDLDRDGNLDIYVCQYLQFTESAAPHSYSQSGEPTYPPVLKFDGKEDFLLRSRGEGFAFDERFGPHATSKLRGMGVAAADFDRDGIPEILVANDMQPNLLLTVDPSTGSLRDLGVESGVGFNGDGDVQAGMGIACDDFNGDGMPDVAITHLVGEGSTFWKNRSAESKRLHFTDQSDSMGLTAKTRAVTGWGVAALDYDNDGWPDLVMTNGHVRDETNGPSFAMLPQLLANIAGRRFEDVSSQAGPYFTTPRAGRGLACADYDQDGRIDLAISHYGTPVALLHNETESATHSLDLQLVGRRSNRNGVGATVTVMLGGLSGSPLPMRFVRQMMGGGSYLSASSLQIHIGLGPHRDVHELGVAWPSGAIIIVQDLRSDRRLRLVEP